MFGKLRRAMGSAKEADTPTLDNDAPRVLYAASGGAGLRTAPLEAQATVAPAMAAQPGDDVLANNTLDADAANGLLGAVRLTVSSAQEDAGAPGGVRKDQRGLLPTALGLKAHVTPDFVVYTVSVDFANPWAERTCAALLQIPRVKGLLLLEERHRAGDVVYAPEVMEKQAAQEKFQAAAASETHSASLSNADDEFFEVKIDKIAPGAVANFTACLLQPQTREVEMVVEDGDQDAMAYADLLIAPVISGLEEDTPVPFRLDVSFSDEYRLCPVPFVVARDSLAQLRIHEERSRRWYGSSPPSLPPRALIVVEPEEGARNRACFAMPDGLVSSALVLVRLCRTKVDPMLAELTEKMKAASVDADAGSLQPARAVVAPELFFDTADGAPMSFSNVEVSVPNNLEGVGPSEVPHRIFLIVDVSGSTSMRVDTGESFLEKCVSFLQGMVRALPKHVAALREAGSINGEAVEVNLWSFCGDAKALCTTVMQNAPEEEMLAVLEADLLKKAGKLRSGGSTNYDSFSTALLDKIETTEPRLNHVLLFTDGGATSLQRFEANVQTMRAHPNAAFFQADCLGYGPWLNPKTVQFFSRETGGEAIMVEKPHGEEMRLKLLGLVARSMLRAANTFELSLHGGDLVAVAALDKNDAPGATKVRELDEDAAGWRLSVLPGQRLRLGVVHRSSTALALAVSYVPLSLESETPAEPTGDGDDWELINEAGAGGLAASEAALRKIVGLQGTKKLDHILLLEPAYGEGVVYPTETEAARKAALMRLSVTTQVPAPSVTRGCAVAKLEANLTPIPESCRPEQQGKWSTDFGLDHGGIRGAKSTFDVEDSPDECEEVCFSAMSAPPRPLPVPMPRMPRMQMMSAPMAPMAQMAQGPGSSDSSPMGSMASGSADVMMGARLGSAGSAAPAPQSASVGAPAPVADLAAASGPPGLGTSPAALRTRPADRRAPAAVPASAARQRSKKAAKSKAPSASRRGKKLSSISAKPEEAGPKTLKRWLQASRGGVLEPVTDVQNPFRSLVGSWNYFEEIAKELGNVDAVRRAMTAPIYENEAPEKDPVDAVSAASGQLADMAKTESESEALCFGGRLFRATLPEDVGARRRVLAQLEQRVLARLRALLVSFVLCAAAKATADLSGVLHFSSDELLVDVNALKATGDRDVVGVARELLDASRK